jgi:hypothetical protein
VTSGDVRAIWMSLLAAIAVMAVGMSWIISRPAPDLDSRPIPEWTPNIISSTKNSFQAPRPVDLQEILARPLFRQSRRPFDASRVVAVAPPPVQPIAPAPLPVPAAAPPQFTAKGIVFSGSYRTALIVKPDSPDGTWVTKGVELEGWQVVDITDAAVTMKSAGETITLNLYVDNKAN